MKPSAIHPVYKLQFSYNNMSKNQLGEFEEVVLLTIAVLKNHAYGVAIGEEMETRLNRSVSIGALQTVLRRMEKKGLLTSAFGEATKARGGKRKRYFSLTAYGKRMMTETMEQRLSLWKAIPDYSMQIQHG